MKRRAHEGEARALWRCDVRAVTARANSPMPRAAEAVCAGQKKTGPPRTPFPILQCGDRGPDQGSVIDAVNTKRSSSRPKNVSPATEFRSVSQ